MKYIAFYFPQFHSIEENNQWWGHQFTDWELVQAAQQYTEEQRQPRIPLNLANPIGKKIRLSRLQFLSLLV